MLSASLGSGAFGLFMMTAQICRRSRFGLIPHFALCTLAALLSGCVISPLATRTAAFSTAASIAVRQTENVYQLVNKAHFDAQVDVLVVNFDKNGFDPSKVQPFLPEKDVVVRTKVLDGLREYATELAEVSGNQPITELDTQAKASGQALSGLQQDDFSGFKISSTEQNIAVTAVVALGHQLAENERAKELPAILEKMDKPVQDICTILESDIGTPDKPGLANALNSDYDLQIAAQQKYIRDNASTMSAEEKRAAIEVLPRLVQAQQRSDDALQETVKSLRALAEAHAALASSKNLKDSPAFKVKLAELIQSAQSLGTFYGALSSSTTTTTSGG